MDPTEDIKTIKNISESKYKEKGSVFICKALHILNEEEADRALEAIRKEYFDAAHHCYAYKLASGNVKYSDDGEPSGTAGVRIVNALEHFGLTNCIAVIIRYFGGIKLGVGPLGKAYYKTALQTLQSAEIIEQKKYCRVSIDCDFQLSSQCHRILSNHRVKILESNYNTKVNLVCLIISREIEIVGNELREISKGQIEIRVQNEYTYL